MKLSKAQHDALVADPLNGGKAMMGEEYMMTTRAALVMADHLDKKGLAAVRATYPGSRHVSEKCGSAWFALTD